MLDATNATGRYAARGAAASGAPQAVSARYEVFWNGTRVAVQNETFEARDGQYRIVSESRAVGPLALIAPRPLRATSSGRRTDAGLLPQLFEGGRGSNDPRRVHAEFDWEAERLTVARRDRNEILPLPPGTQDQLSIMYQFMFLAPDRPQLWFTYHLYYKAPDWLGPAVAEALGPPATK